MAHSGTIIYMRTVPGKPLNRALTQPLYVKNFDGSDGFVPCDFEWDGSSVPWIFQGIFPRHNHPIASCRHDWRCRNAKNAEERKWADELFRDDVGTTSWWITKQFGYLGVRIGAMLYQSSYSLVKPGPHLLIVCVLTLANGLLGVTRLKV